MPLLNRILPTLLLLMLFWVSSVLAEQERIISYHSDITVDSDSTMVVVETIKVYAAGYKIKRGIFRDFPTHTTDDLGKSKVAGFELLEVTRQGKPEPHHLNYYREGVRIYLGDEDYFLETGEHTYTIKYQTDRQMGFYPEHDELYWNVTGNFWDFVIEQSSADVHLPARFGEDNLDISAFTGAYGSIETDYITFVSDRGDIHFESNSPLQPYEGLTLVVKFPKGKIQPPSAGQLRAWWLDDHRVQIFAFVGVMLLFCYYFITWLIVGVDPKPGNMSPVDSPPGDLSPAALRYIHNLSSDQKTFIAAILSMGTKGWLKVVEDEPGKFWVHKKSDGAIPMAREEEVIYAELFNGRESLEIDKENHTILSACQSKLAAALGKAFKGKLFFLNRDFVVFGAIASVVMAIITLIQITHPDRAENTASITFMIFAFVILNFLFGALMPRYTKAGRAMRDAIEGYSVALQNAGTAGLNLNDEVNRERFNNYLPYAVALGVHAAWSRQMEKVFARGESTSRSNPDWYSPYHSHSYSLPDLTNEMSSTFSSSVSSASKSPSSGSGSSGGFSGGGGGGGGGGGW